MSDPLVMCTLHRCSWIGPRSETQEFAGLYLCPRCAVSCAEVPAALADAWRVRERAEAELAAEVAREAIDEGDYLRRRLLERILHPEEAAR